MSVWFAVDIEWQADQQADYETAARLLAVDGVASHRHSVGVCDRTVHTMVSVEADDMGAAVTEACRRLAEVVPGAPVAVTVMTVEHADWLNEASAAEHAALLSGQRRTHSDATPMPVDEFLTNLSGLPPY